MAYKNILNILIITALLSCNSYKKNNINSKPAGYPLTIDLRKWNKQIEPIKLSSIAQDVLYTQLETKPGSLINTPLAVVMNDSYIFVESRGKVYQFYKDGEFIRRVNTIGKGPEECYSRTFTINSQDKLIYVYGNYQHNIKTFGFDGKPYWLLM